VPFKFVNERGDNEEEDEDEEEAENEEEAEGKAEEDTNDIVVDDDGKDIVMGRQLTTKSE
jgi:hypothetical protein